MRENQAGLWRYVRALGCDALEADDLVQQVFLEVWQRPFEDRGPKASTGYLMRAARNRFLDAVRRKRTRPAFGDLDEAQAVWREYAREDEGESYRDALRLCLKTLRQQARAALVFFYRDGQNRIEIGERLGMTPDGVKTLMRRARAALRSCITRKLEA